MNRRWKKISENKQHWTTPDSIDVSDGVMNFLPQPLLVRLCLNGKIQYLQRLCDECDAAHSARGQASSNVAML